MHAGIRQVRRHSCEHNSWEGCQPCQLQAAPWRRGVSGFTAQCGGWGGGVLAGRQPKQSCQELRVVSWQCLAEVLAQPVWWHVWSVSAPSRQPDTTPGLHCAPWGSSTGDAAPRISAVGCAALMRRLSKGKTGHSSSCFCHNHGPMSDQWPARIDLTDSIPLCALTGAAAL